MTATIRRNCEYDLARIVLMLLLPIVHLVQYWGYVCDGADLMVHADADMIDHVARFACYFIAPCFMIMMGINMLFTRKNTARDFLRRGLILLGVEVIFNLVRYLLPALLGFAIGHYEPAVLDYALYGQLNSDILAFAGLAFLVAALIKKLEAMDKMLYIAAAMWLAGDIFTRAAAPWLNDHCHAQVLNAMGSLVWVNADSNFPLLSWMIYPALGYRFACRIRQAEDDAKREQIWRGAGIAALLFVACELLATAFLGDGNYYEILSVNGAHHHLTPTVLIFSTGSAFLLLWAGHKIAPMLSAQVQEIAAATGSQLTNFYLIQWTLVGWGLFLTGGTGYWGSQAMTFWPAVGAIVLIEAVSFIPAIVRYRKQR